ALAVEGLSGRATDPGHRPAVAVPDRAAQQVVAVAQHPDQGAVRKATPPAHPVIGVGAHQAIGRGDGAAATGGGVAPGGGPAGAVPQRAAHQVIAVAEQGDELRAHLVVRVGADQTVGLGEGAAEPGVAVDPGHRPTGAVPIHALDEVIAAAQDADAVQADAIVGITADQAVGGGDGATDPGRAIAPGDRPAVAVPNGRRHRVVAAPQDDDRRAPNPIIGAAAGEAVGLGDGATNPRGATAPRYRAAPTAPERTGD